MVKKSNIKTVRISDELEKEIFTVCDKLQNMGVDTNPSQLMRISLELVFKEPQKLVDRLTDGRVLTR